MERTPTYYQARILAIAAGFKLVKIDGEYQVTPIDGTEADTYYADDLADALDTIDNW